MAEARTGIRICAACEHRNPGDALFCARCGAPFTPGAAAEEPLQPFSVTALVVLHYLTFGIFSAVWVNVSHGALPRRRPDDPTVGRAVGFLFIPFYNIYWWFFTHLRLCERLNEESALRGTSATTPRGLALWTGIVHWIPFVDLVSYLILYPVLAARIQTQVNELAAARAQAMQQPGLPSGAGAEVPARRRVCGLCRFVNPADAVYCASCGESLGGEAPSDGR